MIPVWLAYATLAPSEEGSGSSIFACMQILQTVSIFQSPLTNLVAHKHNILCFCAYVCQRVSVCMRVVSSLGCAAAP